MNLKEIEKLFRDIEHEEDGEAVWWLINRVEALTKALEFECGGRCAKQNQCNAKEVLENKNE